MVGRPTKGVIKRKGNLLYGVWSDMIQRCYNPKSARYRYYGAKGIVVCQEWRKNFDLFYEWAINNGYKKGLTIERMDSHGNYDPLNCKWATWAEQQLTKSSSIISLVDNKYYTLTNLAIEFQCSRKMVKEILNINKSNKMRIQGTKYDQIDTLPTSAQPVSQFALNSSTAVGYVYVKYERYLKGKGSYPGYVIKCFKGSNFIIPD